MEKEPPTPTKHIQRIVVSNLVELILHSSKLVIRGSSWGSGVPISSVVRPLRDAAFAWGGLGPPVLEPAEFLLERS